MVAVVRRAIIIGESSLAATNARLDVGRESRKMEVKSKTPSCSGHGGASTGRRRQISSASGAKRPELDYSESEGAG